MTTARTIDLESEVEALRDELDEVSRINSDLSDACEELRRDADARLLAENRELRQRLGVLEATLRTVTGGLQ